MRQIWITKAGPPEVLQVREAPDPDAGEGQIRVRVRASGINFADLVARTGMYRDAPPIPCVVGYEASGVIDQVGPGVKDFAVGDRVFAMPKFGGYSDTIVLKAEQAFAIPPAMSFEEAAALPVAYLTAYHITLGSGPLRPGMQVLIGSVAGGVGLAALELASAHGCEVFGTASPGKHEFVRARGCTHALDSGQPVTPQVRAIIGEQGGMDLILDAIGGPSWGECYKLLGPGGRLVCFGISTMTQGKKRSIWAALGMLFSLKWWSPIRLMLDNHAVQGVNMTMFFDRLDLARPMFAELVKLYEGGKIKPYVDQSFKFDDAPAAHHYLHDRKAKGKVLLVP
jgi:NADPH:quinone reductase-like Zn-dependent oxidoreductase